MSNERKVRGSDMRIYSGDLNLSAEREKSNNGSNIFFRLKKASNRGGATK